MTVVSAGEDGTFEEAHPLAYRLRDDLAAGTVAPPVLEIGNGRGRNTRMLRHAGIALEALADDVPYTQLPLKNTAVGAVLATHAFLHGAVPKLRAGFAEVARVLVPGGALYVTLGSIEDARFGLGTAIDEHTFAPGDGEEAGIPHAYFDRDGVVTLLRGFSIDRLEEVDVDEIVGRWAHGEDDELGGRRHWFVQARRT